MFILAAGNTSVKLLKYVFVVTLVRLEQPEKAFAPTLVTDDGMVIVVRLEEPWNALAAILVMVEPIVTLAKLVRAHTGSAPA